MQECVEQDAIVVGEDAREKTYSVNFVRLLRPGGARPGEEGEGEEGAGESALWISHDRMLYGRETGRVNHRAATSCLSLTRQAQPSALLMKTAICRI